MFQSSVQNDKLAVARSHLPPQDALQGPSRYELHKDVHCVILDARPQVADNILVPQATENLNFHLNLLVLLSMKIPTQEKLRK